jgi:hypothetical protein
VLSSLSGKSLKLIATDCSIYCKQMEEFELVQAFEFTLPFWQSALNLMGLSKNTTILQGDAVHDPEEFLLRERNPQLVALMQFQQSRMYAIFDKHKEGADLSIANGYDLSTVAPGDPCLAFCGGISSFEVARKTQKRKFEHQVLGSKR